MKSKTLQHTDHWPQGIVLDQKLMQLGSLRLFSVQLRFQENASVLQTNLPLLGLLGFFLAGICSPQVWILDKETH